MIIDLHDYRKYSPEVFQKLRKTNPQALQPLVQTVRLRLSPAVIAKDIEGLVDKHLKETKDTTWYVNFHVMLAVPSPVIVMSTTSTRENTALDIENQLLLALNPSSSLCLDPSPKVVQTKACERLNTPHLQANVWNLRCHYHLIDQHAQQRHQRLRQSKAAAAAAAAQRDNSQRHSRDGKSFVWSPQDLSVDLLSVACPSYSDDKTLQAS